MSEQTPTKTLAQCLADHRRCPIIIKDKEALALLRPYVTRATQQILSTMNFSEHPAGTYGNNIKLSRVVPPCEYWFKNDAPVVPYDRNLDHDAQRGIYTDDNWEMEFEVRDGILHRTSYWYRGSHGMSVFGAWDTEPDDEYFLKGITIHYIDSETNKAVSRPQTREEQAQELAKITKYYDKDGKFNGYYKESSPACRGYMGHATFNIETLEQIDGMSLVWY